MRILGEIGRILPERLNILLSLASEKAHQFRNHLSNLIIFLIFDAKVKSFSEKSLYRNCCVKHKFFDICLTLTLIRQVYTCNIEKVAECNRQTCNFSPFLINPILNKNKYTQKIKNK